MAATHRGDRVERARLYKAANEGCFGVQIATKIIAEGVAAAALAKEAGARWLDINCGCPIYGVWLWLWRPALCMTGTYYLAVLPSNGGDSNSRGG